jgi:hypothetical protein
MQRTRGVSLAKGPIALVGLLGIIYGLTALIIRAHGFALHFPSGHVHGKIWLHLMVNGWTALLFIAAGVALLFSAAAHITAKTMAMIVGVALIVLAIIAYAQKHGALGIFAADHWTELIWGVAGVVLLVLALMPRVGGRTVQTAPATGAAGATTTAAPRRRTVARDESVASDEPASRETTDTSTSTAGAGSQSATRDEPLVRREQRVPDRDEDA